MFEPLNIPFGCVMLYNVVKLKEGVVVEDVELTLGELCNVVKNTYGDDKGGFIGGQVYKFSGFVSDEGSIASKKQTEDHIAIVTYWQSYEQHEKSHADKIFKEKFDELAEEASETYEIGYEMLWQGTPEEESELSTVVT
jgi:aspartate 1-decarboxylase